ncbi:MAG TPA: hypothetical protein VHL58_13425 [Thermoanaerobaculia bacterium]|nr:hypothetical protein [Thermoanaerobaculia bacterium]
MPKTIFYSGVVASFLVALLCGAQAAGWVSGISPAPLRFADSFTSEIALGALLLLVALPLSCLLIRIASLLAARNLFSGFVATASSGCTLLASVFLAACEWRMAFTHSASGVPAATVQLLSQIRSVSLLIFGMSVVLALLSIRPYFRAQANGILSALLCLPGFLLARVLIDQAEFLGGSSMALAPTPSSALFLSLMSLIFGALGVHCLRHRHSFIEVTNLRELLDSRIDAQGSDRRRRFGFSSDIAFDS